MLRKILIGLGAVIVIVVAGVLIWSYIRNEERGPGQESADWAPVDILDPALFERVAPGREITVLAASQGWDDDTRAAFWHEDQGSLLTPYDIFVNLAAENGDGLFHEPASMAQYRYLPAKATADNPDGLPIGFTRGDEEWQGETYAGMTCAACHTSLVMSGDTALLIDGAPTQADFQTMSTDLSKALTRAYEDDASFEAMAARMGVNDDPGKAELRARLESAALAMAERVELNATPTRYGFGRLDAVGQIYNSVASANLGLPGNRAAPSAPVSYPFLWGTGQSDVVQWTGFAPNAAGGMLVRNTGEVLGVFGGIDVTSLDDWLEGGFESSVNIKDLGDVEAWVNDLEPPAWPTQVFGAIDIDKAAAGKALYDENCAACHQVVTPYETYKAVLTKVDEVGTDPAAEETSLQTVTLDGEETAKLTILVKETVGAILRKPGDALDAAAVEALPDKFGQTGSDTYKARPLNAIWATAPYLHNGSVPTLDDLLRPEAERPASFTTGGFGFDPVKVGIVHYEGEDAFTLDTGVKANGNMGHAYGTTLGDAERAALLEYLKTL